MRRMCAFGCEESDDLCNANVNTRPLVPMSIHSLLRFSGGQGLTAASAESVRLVVALAKAGCSLRCRRC